MLPPGPKAPVAIQTYEWVARPTALLRRCQARYGEPFTLRTAWADAPVVLVSDPAEVRRVFTADPEVVRAGASSTFLEPFAGSHSILVLDGAEHLRQRRLMLPPLHGERMLAHRALVGQIASAEVASWAPGRALRTHPRMQSVALEVMMRAVFGLRAGAELVHVRAAIRRALDMTTSLPRLFALSLAQHDLGARSPWGAFRRAVDEVDVLLGEVIARARSHPGEGSILSLLLAARHEDGSPPADEELRDQLMEMKEVLRVVITRVDLRPVRTGSERMRRRTVTLTPARGGIVVPQSLRSTGPRCRSSAATTA